ncbi:AAA family ATPase [Flavobacterium jejuense]|uniref:AAA family ATPase n=1 Tax=Flavobacterium jejuense TaxID=1544455 RepID=A0ABX0INR7_9FLAO|nr:ATP-binding protein [Flavobacterium jejuense]NHN25236.1 AAA family ATPase [Flavobacterium jejuense]
MRIDKVHIKSRFKNLEDFTIDIDENAWETVLLGLNATGKSNFLEAIVIVFRDLDLIYNYNKKIKSPFEFYIKYECRNNHIEITYENEKYNFIVNGKSVTTEFTKSIDYYLPKHIFVYYSGISDRLADLYIPHQKLYYEEIIKKDAEITKFDTIRRIFLAQNIHANFALIAFFMFQDEQSEDDETINFLKEELKINDFGSALFMLKQPIWAKSRKNKNSLLWGAKGLVKNLLEELLKFSYAPIQYKERIEVSYKKAETQDRLYLYLKDKKTFLDLIEYKYKNKIELFNALESIHISDMLHDVKIKVQKEGVNGELSMSELSEGEKQLLSVLGLLKFTNDEESLILLDEPDTHLNPMWKWKFLDYLDKVVKRKENTQIIFCSHDPLVIGNLKKNQVQIFKKNKEGKTEAFNPNISPREMSVSKILTSELFGIPSLMSKKLEDLLNQKRYFQAKISQGLLQEDEKIQFERLIKYFDSIGFNDETVDSRYNQYLKLTSNYEEFINRKYTKDEAAELDKIAKEVLEEILKEEKEK